MMNATRTAVSKKVTEAELSQVAQDLASQLKAGDVLLLAGEMGSGKTTFVRYLSEALGSTSTVSSPTFTLIQQYDAKLHITHMDLYRLDSPQALEELAFSELIEKNKKGLLCIEWPKWVTKEYPHLATVLIELDYCQNNPDHRSIRVSFPQG